MIKALVTEFFNEIEKRELKKNKNAKATFWIQELQEVSYTHKNYIAIKNATRVYEKYVEDKKNVSVKEPDKFLCNVMAAYLNYENYEEYKSEHEVPHNIMKPSRQKITLNFKEKMFLHKISIVSGILLLFSLFFFIYKYNTIDTGKCIVWKANLFLESPCSAKNAINNARYHIDIHNFKKIEVTNETLFFLYGEPILWYGKSEVGEINFFTHRGIHPETLKELKPVTKYIINKYILIDENDKRILN
jgi:hypothetical protein